MLLNRSKGTLPQIFDEIKTFENNVCWGNTEDNHQFFISAVIEATAVDAGSDPQTLLRAGLILEFNQGTSKWRNWVSGGTCGILVASLNLLSDEGVAEDKFDGIVMMSGKVKAGQLIESIGNSTPGSWIGTPAETGIRDALAASGFKVDDDFSR